jgi:pimeloyl-ACP methyl ester carboxylesterase
MPALLSFLREFAQPGSVPVEVIETTYDRGGGRRDPATIYHPSGARAPLPAWVLLHGITWTGRSHPQLIRLARALSASGSVVMVPEISEWRALRVAPEIAVPVIREAVLDLDARPDTLGGHTRLFGSSFGATQAILASADARLDGHLAAVASWGGYADIQRAVRFLFTGEHELDGKRYFEDPDPYGRYILGANFLTTVEGHEDADDVAGALHDLAAESGRRGVFAGSPIYDDFKRERRLAIAPERRELYDVFAPVGRRQAVAGEPVERLADALAAAAVAREPLFDAARWFEKVRAPVLVAHGRHDSLIPFTEAERLHNALGAHSRGVTITEMYAHSGAGGARNLIAGAVGSVRLARLMGRLIRLDR